MWHAGCDVAMEAASFFFALTWRYPMKATIDTLIVFNDEAFAVCRENKEKRMASIIVPPN